MDHQVETRSRGSAMQKVSAKPEKGVLLCERRVMHSNDQMATNFFRKGILFTTHIQKHGGRDPPRDISEP